MIGLSFFFSPFPLKPSFRRILPSFFGVSKGQWQQTRCFSLLSSCSVWNLSLLNRSIKYKFFASVKKRQISNTVRGEKRKASCFFLQWPWRRREESSETLILKWGKKNNRPINKYILFGNLIIFFFSILGLPHHYLSIKNYTSPSLSIEKISSNITCLFHYG